MKSKQRGSLTNGRQPVCAYCKREMHYTEWRAFYNKETKVNDVICPQCFKIHTGSENYLMCMFKDTWIIDGVKYPK